MCQSIKFSDIPEALLPLIASNDKAMVYLNGLMVKEVFIYRETQIRVNTSHGQYRYGIDTTLIFEICT